MKKLAMMVVLALFVSASSASAWWIFGKKATDEPAKDAAEEVQKGDAAQKASCEMKRDAFPKAKCASMSEEKKSKCEAKKAKKAEKKAECEMKKAEKNSKAEAKKADKKAKKAEREAKKAAQALEAPAEAAPAAAE